MSLAHATRTAFLKALDDAMRVLALQNTHQLLAAPPFSPGDVERQVLREAPLPDPPPNPLQEVHHWPAEAMLTTRGLYLLVVYEGVAQAKIGMLESHLEQLKELQLPAPAGVEQITLVAPSCVLYADLVARENSESGRKNHTGHGKTLALQFDHDVTVKLTNTLESGEDTPPLQFRDTSLRQLADIYAEEMRIQANSEAAQTLLMALMHRLRYLLVSTQAATSAGETDSDDISPISKTGQKHRQLCRDAIEFAQTNLQQTLSIEEIAAHLGVSQSHLSRVFHLEYGETLIHYLSTMRIHIAQTLLRSTNEPVGAVARQTGFSSAESFSHVFRKHTGMSPKQFRTQHKLQA